MSKPPRIAIVGGGPAGLSAAFHLTELYAQRGQPFDITVYQIGWRLGGKAATGRDPDKGHRIEEHGIHGFCKFYFHAWEMMRKVYARVPRNGLPVSRIEDAFLPSSTVYRVENVEGTWTAQLGSMPEGSGHPWDGAPDISKRAILLGLLESLWKRDRGTRGDFDARDLFTLSAEPEIRRAAERIQDTIQATFERTKSVLTQRFDEPVGQLERAMRDAGERLEALREDMQTLFRQMQDPSAWLGVHRALGALDLGLALFRGLVHQRFWDDRFDLDDLDCFDYRAWLEQHGARTSTLASASVITVANMLFAYPDGDSTRPPDLSAACWLNWVLRSVIGRGAYFYMFAAGSGETVMLPIYAYLRNLGVKFEFFHKLVGVRSGGNAGRRVLEQLVFERQTETLKGPYEPLASLPRPNGDVWSVWPNEPNWDQLRDGDLNKNKRVDYEDWGGPGPSDDSKRILTHRAAEDGFEYVVWAIPSSMIPEVGDDGMQQEWRKTIELLPHTATQAVQIWLDRDTKDLGWPRSSLPRKTSRYAGGSFPNPLSGMVAYDDLICFEGWAADGPRGLIYFCAPMQRWPNVLGRDEERVRVRQAASATLRLLGNFLTGARMRERDRPDPQAIDFQRLYDPTGREGEARLEFQYVRANTRPTEAYIRSPKGSVTGRRDAWNSGYENLVIAGDWMYNGLNLGSFESAVTGGKLAAFALLATPGDVEKQVKSLEGMAFLHPGALARVIAAIRAGTVPFIP